MNMDQISTLRKLRDAATEAIKPNDNAGNSDWVSRPMRGGTEYMILTPAYRHDPRRRMMVGEINIDGLNKKEASKRSAAVAEFLCAGANLVPEFIGMSLVLNEVQAVLRRHEEYDKEDLVARLHEAISEIRNEQYEEKSQGFPGVR